MKGLSVFLIAILLFTGIATKSQAAEAVPKDMRGDWAHPDCAEYDEAFIITKFFYLKSSREKTVFHPAALIGARGDYSILEIGGTPHPALRSEDSLLRIGDMGGDPVERWAKEWDDLHLLGRNEYAGCFDTPTVVPLPLVRVMKHVDDVAASCGEEMGAACRRLLFSIVDANDNKRLSPAEFSKAGALVAAFLPLAAGKAVATAEMEAAYRQGVAEGAAAAERLLATQDADGSGDLSLEELEGADTPELRKAAAGLARVFEGLGIY